MEKEQLILRVREILSEEFENVSFSDYLNRFVEYKLKVTEDAIDSETTQNSATLTYSNNPKTDETSTTPPVEEYVYSSEISDWGGIYG